MADKKISQLTAASTPLAGTEVLPIVQSGSTVKVESNDLTVKNVRSNATTGILQIAGPAAAATRTMTVPDANFTAARTDAAQTFTGAQTFSSNPILDGGTTNGVLYLNGSKVATSGSALTFDGTNLSASLGLKAASAGTVVSSFVDGLSVGGFESIGFLASPGNALAIGGYRTSQWSAVEFYASGSLQATLNSTGNLTVNTGNLVVGTAAKGIDFSANTGAAGETSALLNWYEEGTWTPDLTFETPGDLALTYGVRLGTYTRVGRLVTVAFRITTTAFTWSTASGDLQVGGLPFAARSLTNMRWITACSFNGITKANYTQLNAEIRTASSIILFNMSGSGQSQSGVSTANVPSGGAPFLAAVLTYEA